MRECETVPAERTPENLLGVYTLTPENVRNLSEEELAEKRLDAEAARAARFRGVYAMIGSRIAVYPSGAPDIGLGVNARPGTATAGAELAKGVTSWDESG